ncbi:MAG TPA: alpha/beta fold hydrolase, partial [Marmoricola sp.]|nr:alpha/beta fold hydrolase [Marmoricola sp.]
MPGIPAHTESALAWGACPSEVMVPGAQCAKLRVPLDYSNPSGAQITLELSRLAHTSGPYLGAMLANPGGPGGSGVNMSGMSLRVPRGVGSQFDWIGWDPRGVGLSEPSLHCDPNYNSGDRPAYDLAKNRAVWLKRAADYAKACGENGGALLAHMTTEDNARDMDSIRQALGQSKISYYGYSWGSYLGQVYLTLFPTHVKRVVLDGVVDPRGVWYQGNLDQDVAFQKTIGIFFDWVGRNNATYHLGANRAAVQAAFSRELAQLANRPADNGQVGPDEFIDATLDAGYYVFNWDQDATNMAKLINNHDGSGIESTYQQRNAGPDNENQTAVYNAVQCTDAPWPGLAQTLKDNATLAKRAPFETWANMWFNAPCLTWPAAAKAPIAIKAATNLPQILLIAETFDAATPFSGALQVRSIFPTSSLIEGVNGSTHAGSLNGVACTDNAVADYLSTGR